MATEDSPFLSFLPTPAVIGHENAHPEGLPSEQRSPATTRPAQSEKPFHSRSTTSSTTRTNGIASPFTSPTRQQLGSNAGSPILYPASFIDQSRALLEQQRRHFDQERGLFDQERAMWDIERKALCGRIDELERLMEGSHPGRMSSGQGSVTGKALSFHHPRSGSEKGDGLARHSSMPESGDRFWEGGSSRQGLVPSRVFTSPTSAPRNKTTLSTISEKQNGTNGDGKDVPMINTGIDISLIRNDLDGITLKKSAVPANLISKIISPTSPSRKGPSSGHLSIPDSDSDSNSNLTRNAGHTPKLAPIPLPLSIEEEVGSSNLATPTQTTHLHRPSIAPTGEGSRSTTTTTNPNDLDLDEDPALHSPLTLSNDIGSAADSRFLEALDSKLLHEARKVVYNPSLSTPSSSSAGPPSVVVVDSGREGDDRNKPQQKEGEGLTAGSDGGAEKKNIDRVEVDDVVETPEPEIKLRFKRSMNFGSAFGSTGFGTSK